MVAIVTTKVAKTTPRAMSSLLNFKSKKKATKFKIAPRAINFPNCPCPLKIVKPSTIS